jgi:hypothetical protein
MSDAEYLVQRAHEELIAAMKSSDHRVREVHLELADAYAFRLREMKRQERAAAVATDTVPTLPAEHMSLECRSAASPIRQPTLQTSRRSVSFGGKQTS